MKKLINSMVAITFAISSIYSPSAFAIDSVLGQPLINQTPTTSPSTSTTAVSSGTSPAPTQTLADPNPLSAASPQPLGLPGPVPAGWKVAASNSNYAFTQKPDATQLNTYLYMIDLRNPSEEILIGGGSRVRHFPARYDVSPDGKVVAVSYSEIGGPAIGTLSGIIFYRMSDLKNGQQINRLPIVPAEVQSMQFQNGNVVVKAIVPGPGYSVDGETRLKTFTVSIADILGEPSVPAHQWTATASNANYVYRLERAGETIQRPGTNIQNIYILNLATGEERMVDISDGITKVDVSANGNSVTYSYSTSPGTPSPFINRPRAGTLTYVISTRQVVTAAVASAVILYPNGKVHSTFDFDYSNGVISSRLYTQYAANGSLARIVEIDYFPDGKTVGVSIDRTYTNGVLTSEVDKVFNSKGVLQQKVNWTFHPNGKPKTKVNSRYINGVLTSTKTYTYDAKGNLVKTPSTISLWSVSY